MKISNFVSMAVIAALMVVSVGCTTLYDGMGGYEEAPQGRVYRQVPYGSNQVIVLERDPFTGQYYQVSPYGAYGSPYGGRVYGNSFPNNQGYRTYPRGNGGGGGYYRGGNGGGNTARPAPQPQRRGSETTDRAKDIIRGGN